MPSMKTTIALLLMMRVAWAEGGRAPTPVALPDGAPGIGFDDLRYASGLHKVLAPAGRTGKLDLVDPATRAVTAIAGFSVDPKYGGGHDDSVTSADEGAGWLFATDRTKQSVAVVDAASATIKSSVKLAAGPDYVRFVAKTGEVWVSEPDGEQIEIFKLDGGALKSIARIKVAGGPESLVIDASRGRAYSNLWKSTTVAIDLDKRAIVERWENGCGGSRGLALDEKRGWVFVGCAEGRAVVLDAAHGGKVLASEKSATGVDIVDYNAALAHLYVPGGKSAAMTVFAVAPSGALSKLGEVPTAAGAHCVVADERAQAWVCDPSHGRLLLVEDRWRKAAP
jgi:hypothetical protein